jgi:hypothetical protein
VTRSGTCRVGPPLDHSALHAREIDYLCPPVDVVQQSRQANREAVCRPLRRFASSSETRIYECIESKAPADALRALRDDRNDDVRTAAEAALSALTAH